VHDEQSPVFFQGVIKASAAGQQTHAGTVKVKIEGRGNYKSNMTAQYQILPPRELHITRFMVFCYASFWEVENV